MLTEKMVLAQMVLDLDMADAHLHDMVLLLLSGTEVPHPLFDTAALHPLFGKVDLPLLFYMGAVLLLEDIEMDLVADMDLSDEGNYRADLLVFAGIHSHRYHHLDSHRHVLEDILQNVVCMVGADNLTDHLFENLLFFLHIELERLFFLQSLEK
jgi:hypothetical protein